MRVNFFEGFKKQMQLTEEDSFKAALGTALNINPTDVGEDYLDTFIVANPVINGKYQLKGNIRFKVIRRGVNTVTIMDISTPDPKNRNLSDFPHGVNVSANAGKEYTITKDEYEKFIQWQLPAASPEGGPM